MLTRTRDLIKWLFGVFMTIAIVLGLAWLFETQPALKKEAILEGRKDRVPASVSGGQGKGGGSLLIAIETAGRTGEGVLILKAKIESRSDLQDVKYQWVLPPGVTITSGSTEGDLGSVTPEEAKTLEATFLVPPSENKQIHLQVYSLINGERMGDVAQYNTKNEAEIERSLASKREVLEMEVSEGAQKPQLIH